MICHKRKVIFIHISKCAGSTIEKAFGIDVGNTRGDCLKNFYGWDKRDKIYLQHATPQELIDLNKMTQEQWEKYYKFIIIRNPWSRAVSDYLWVVKGRTIVDSFSNFLKRKGQFFEILNDPNQPAYRGDHLKKQKEYFLLNGEKINYDLVIRLENIEQGLDVLKMDLNLGSDFKFNKTNIGQKKYKHYSFFYNKKRKKLVDQFFGEDAIFFGYEFEDRKKNLEKIYVQLPSIFHLPKKHWLKFIKKEIKKMKIYRFVEEN
ncbi:MULTISPECIES: sulfotransferase family 2 domain-containing protein [Mesonia]|uniref:Uncharacterized protein n=1 Tax=Mesonia oceanica TaxID=2687242 RepID=A0AC61Y9Z8_9FLAO|nr:MULTISPECIES: sulfotransferase family 2 domain-containing protein [Mesonia]MAN26654.1 hypothetical protein [Mesonia sp.]MAQ40069.1 hypothetical protein [Mesonia sp.]MBJ96629.1 hypothetical protein [Flavobacteriaceae bacterium]VVV01322.1 hypothetical protein FVB9532_02612 [Mesonia oceanica]|tara:strand:- start:631 stop:1410 length:780 start_codon:yes stop_codon:yes gene_type:complete